MQRSVNQAFNEFLSRLTPLASQRSAAAAHRASVDTALSKKLSIRTSWETGSFHHGTGIRSHSDVDLLISIGNPKPTSSDTALNWVRDALKASFPYTTVRVSRPAVVVEFAGSAETWEIIPGFLTGRGGDSRLVYDIPGAASGWQDTAPAVHLKYVNDTNGIPAVAGGAKKLARLVKAWKYYNNVPISSFYLEMRAAEHVATQSTFIPAWDIYQLLNKLNNHGLAGMNDPEGASGRFFACSSESQKAIALSKLRTAVGRADKALDAYRNNRELTAFTYYDLLFGNRFPSRIY